MPLKHWVVFPSATVEKANATVEAWALRGYRTLVYQDVGSQACNADIVRFGKFPGYYRIINHLVEAAMVEGADVVTCAADDMLPDQKYFAEGVAVTYLKKFPYGDGVMQAIGDTQGQDGNGIQAAARICGSPTFGREWVVRSYEGKGPFWDGYHSFYADEELLNVADKLGLLHQEPALTILHQHWSWGWTPIQPYHERNQENWQADRDTFYSRKMTGFPNSGLLPL